MLSEGKPTLLNLCNRNPGFWKIEYYLEYCLSLKTHKQLLNCLEIVKITMKTARFKCYLELSLLKDSFSNV